MKHILQKPPILSGLDNLRTLHRFILAFILLILTTVVACQSGVSTMPTPSSSPAPTPEKSRILVLGDVSDNPAETIEVFQPLADYLAANLTEFSIEQGNIVVTEDLDTMVDHLKNGQVDIYFDSPYAALTVFEEAGAIPLLRRWKGGVGEYYTMIVAHKDSGMTTLADLLGRTLAFEDEGSTSGYLLPKAHLVNAGYKITEQEGTENVANDDEIGYIFARSEENILAWTLQGKTAAGAINSTDYEELPTEILDQLVVLGQTQAVPRHIVLASPTMDQMLQEGITKLLLEAHLSPKGQTVLETFEKTSQFDLLPGGAVVALEDFQEMFSSVRQNTQ